MKTIVITGINGQLGQYLAKYFQTMHPTYKIVGTLRHKANRKEKYIFNESNVVFDLLDLSDSNSIDLVIQKHKPDYIINTAANAFVGESWQLPIQHFECNALGVLRILESIRKYSPQTRFATLGSSEEIGGDKSGKQQDENTPLSPKSPYGASKAASRHIVKVYRESYNLYALQVMVFNMESPLREEKYVTRKITKGVTRIYKAISEGKPFEPIVLGNLDSMRSWQHCYDVCDGIWRELNQERWMPEYAGNEDKPSSFWVDKIKEHVFCANDTHSVREFIIKSFQNVGIEIVDVNHQRIEPSTDLNGRQINYTTINGDPVVAVSREFYRPADVNFLWGNSARAEQDLKWKATVSFDSLVREMVGYDLADQLN